MQESITTIRLNSVFNPNSIAVVGTSRQHGAVEKDILRNLLLCEFNGSVYSVNPKSSAILGVPSFLSLREIPGRIDLAIVIVSAVMVLDVVNQVIEKGVKALVVISAGFKEFGELAHISHTHRGE